MPLSHDDLRKFLHAIEPDDGFIERVRALAGDRREWFFEAATGALPGLSDDERGHAAYIFGRLSGAADLPRLAKLAVDESRVVRGSAIEAIGRLEDRAGTPILLKLVADGTRPVVDRLQIARVLRTAPIDQATLRGLRKLDLEKLPDELHFAIKATLEGSRSDPRSRP
jgi:hypothetical protein